MARRDLANWLLEHGQPDMAADVKHFSAFPFGVRSDALEVINVWRHFLVKGQNDQIDRFFRQVEQRFGILGWSRDTTLKGQINHDVHERNRIYCWTSGTDSTPRVLLCLNRATDWRVRGGTYHIDERASVAELAKEIQFILAEVLEPAAAAVGLEVSYPRLGPISRVGAKTAAAMTTLAETGDGQWPFPPQVEPLWRKFIHTAYRDDVAIHPEELTAWFIASGWSQDAAPEMTKRFYSDVAPH